MTVGELRKVMEPLSDDALVIIHNDCYEWYGYEQAPDASIKLLYRRTPTGMTGSFSENPQPDQTPEGALVIEFA